MPDAGILATVLLITGLFLLGLECFIPSFGLIGTMAGVCLVVSLWSANKAWGSGANPAFFWTYVFVLVAGIPGTIIGSIYAIQHTGLGRSIVLNPPAAAPPVSSLEQYRGRTGVALTPLTPGGMVLLGQERFHAESIGMLVDPQTTVMVVGTAGNRLVVRPATQEEVHVTSSPSTPIPPTQPPTPPKTMSPPAAEPEVAAVRKSVLSPAVDVKSDTSGTSQDPDKLDFDIPEDYTA